MQEGAQEDLEQRGKTIVTKQDADEHWVRWLKQLIHGELDAVRETHDQAEVLDVFASVTEPEQQAYSAEAETEATRILNALNAQENGWPACSHAAEIRLDSYGNVLGEADEGWEEWAEELEGHLPPKPLRRLCQSYLLTTLLQGLVVTSCRFLFFFFPEACVRLFIKFQCWR